jgi:hypothetical protein
VRVFAVDRIRSIEVTERRFEFLKGFDFEEYQKTALQTVGREPQQVANPLLSSASTLCRRTYLAPLAELGSAV